MEGIKPGDPCSITNDIVVEGQMAFHNAEQVVVEKVDPNPNSPQHKYVVLSQNLQKRFQLSSSDLTVIADPLSEPTHPYCINCGNVVSDNDKFCPSCGTPLSSLAPKVPQEQGFQITKPMVIGGIGVIAMVMIALGSALPWATASTGVFSVSRGGLSGDGVITVILAVIGLGLFAIGSTGKSKLTFVIALVLSMIVLAIAVYDTANVARIATGTQADVIVTVGVGLVLCIIGGVIGLGAGIGGTSAVAAVEMRHVNPEESARIREAYKTGGPEAARALKAKLSKPLAMTTPAGIPKCPTCQSDQIQIIEGAGECLNCGYKW